MPESKNIKPQLRRVGADTTNFVDTKTGEVVHTSQEYNEKLIGITNSYTMFYNDAFPLFILLSPCAKSVVFILVRMYMRSGFFEIGGNLRMSMSKETGYGIKSIRNAILELINCRFLGRNGKRGMYFINPMWCYAGSLAARKKWIEYLIKDGYDLSI